MGNSRPWFLTPSRSTYPEIYLNDEDREKETVSKKYLLDKLQGHMNDLFALPPATIKSCINVIFEIEEKGEA